MLDITDDAHQPIADDLESHPPVAAQQGFPRKPRKAGTLIDPMAGALVVPVEMEPGRRCLSGHCLIDLVPLHRLGPALAREAEGTDKAAIIVEFDCHGCDLPAQSRT